MTALSGDGAAASLRVKVALRRTSVVSWYEDDCSEDILAINYRRKDNFEEDVEDGGQEAFGDSWDKFC